MTKYNHNMNIDSKGAFSLTRKLFEPKNSRDELRNNSNEAYSGKYGAKSNHLFIS